MVDTVEWNENCSFPGMRYFPSFLLVLAVLLARPAVAQAGPSATFTVVAYPEHMVGRKTASGSIYNPHALTVAHPSLAFGTMLELAVPATGRSVMVSVEDRGILSGSRTLIASPAALSRLGLEQEAESEVRVRIWDDEREESTVTLTSGSASGKEQIRAGSAARRMGGRPVAAPRRQTVSPSVPPVAEGSSPSGRGAAGPLAQVPSREQPNAAGYSVQLGSFSDRAAADRLADSMERTWVKAARMGDQTVYRVYYGRFRQRGEAEGWQARLSGLGVHGYVRTLE